MDGCTCEGLTFESLGNRADSEIFKFKDGPLLAEISEHPHSRFLIAHINKTTLSLTRSIHRFPFLFTDYNIDIHIYTYGMYINICKYADPIRFRSTIHRCLCVLFKKISSSRFSMNSSSS